MYRWANKNCILYGLLCAHFRHILVIFFRKMLFLRFIAKYEKFLQNNVQVFEFSHCKRNIVVVQFLLAHTVYFFPVSLLCHYVSVKSPVSVLAFD